MFQEKTHENIRSNILSKIKNMDKREGSFASDIVSAISMVLDDGYRDMEKTISMSLLKGLVGQDLDNAAEEEGLYRKIGTRAIGTVTFTGEPGVTIPKDSIVSTSTGLQYLTVEEAIFIDTTIEVSIKAEEVGSKYNVESGQITTIPFSIPGVSKVNNVTGTKDGTDVETDEQLFDRLLFKSQNPPASGNPDDYKKMVSEFPGLLSAKIFPRDGGRGNVGVMPITTTKDAPSQNLLDDLKEHIDKLRPIGADVIVFAPEVVQINVNATVVLNAGFTIEQAKESYEKVLGKYIDDCILKLYTVDYFKALSLFYDIPEVDTVSNFTLNGGSTNIKILEKQIQKLGSVTLG